MSDAGVVPGAIAAAPLAELVAGLARRSPTPGGGAAAAAAAAIAAALGAMAARYTTGKRYAAISDHAAAFADELERAARACLRLADDDAEAYAAVRAAEGDAARAQAEARAAAVPAELLAACALQATALQAFLPTCNPHLISDARAAIHLLAGAGRAAWHTLGCNRPADELLRVGRAHLAALDAADAAARA